MNYRVAYAVGFHAWEDLAEHPPFADKLMELVSREEDGREPPYGPALDTRLMKFDERFYRLRRNGSAP